MKACLLSKHIIIQPCQKLKYKHSYYCIRPSNQTHRREHIVYKFKDEFTCYALFQPKARAFQENQSGTFCNNFQTFTTVCIFPGIFVLISYVCCCIVSICILNESNLDILDIIHTSTYLSSAIDYFYLNNKTNIQHSQL